MQAIDVSPGGLVEVVIQIFQWRLHSSAISYFFQSWLQLGCDKELFVISRALLLHRSLKHCDHLRLIIKCFSSLDLPISFQSTAVLFNLHHTTLPGHFH
jgi:hypothetical protein